MAKIKGICKNIDGDCSLAFNKTVQEAEKDDFVCSECGAPLKEAPAAGKPAGGNGGNKLIPIIIGAVVAIGAVVGTGFAMGWFDSHTETEELVEDGDGSLTMDIPETEVETGTVEIGDTATSETTPDETAKPIETQEQPAEKVDEPVKPTTTTPTASGKNLGYGYYSGNYPTGVGTIKINRTHTFETTSGSIDAAPGDIVVGAKFKDGKLIQGELHATDGTRTWMSFGAI